MVSPLIPRQRVQPQTPWRPWSQASSEYDLEIESLTIISLFKLAIMTYIWFLCRFSVIGDVIQKVQRHHDLIFKAHAVRQTTLIR